MISFKKVLISLIITPSLLTSFPLLAETKIQEGTPSLAMFGSEEFVSIATGYKRPVHTAPAVATVITAEDIKNSGSRNISDILNMVPGFHVGINYIYWEPGYTVRGFSSAFNFAILFMIDGVPQASLGSIPLDIIERVEISRGPSSALYGADAFTGTVNVITKKYAPEVSEFTLSGGTFDTKNARLITGKKFDAFKLITAIEYHKTDGPEPYIEQDLQSVLDQSFGTNASFAPANAYTQREELSIHANIKSGSSQLRLRLSELNDIGMGVGNAASLDPFGTIDEQIFGITYEYAKHIASNTEINAYLDYRQTIFESNNLHFFPPGAFIVFTDGVVLNSKSDNDTYRAQFSATYNGLSNHILTFGLGGEYDEIEIEKESRNYFIDENGAIIPYGSFQDTTSDSVIGPKPLNRHLYYAYFQDEWNLHRDWSLTYGVRADEYELFGSTVNPRAALVWDTSNDLTTKLIYGRGFREPSLFETDIKHIPSLRSNHDLKPEVINSIDLAMDYTPTEKLRLMTNFYYHETKDQIRLQNSGGPEFTPENVGKLKGKGAEFALWYKLLHNTNLYGYYTFQDTTDETTGKDAGYTPHHRLFAMLQHRYSDIYLSARTTYVGKRDRVAEDTRPRPDKYTLVDLMARWEINNHFEAGIDIRNLFDTDKKEAVAGTSFPADLPLNERNYYLSLTLKN